MNEYNAGMTENELRSGIANELHKICTELRLRNSLKFLELKCTGVSEESLRNSSLP